MRDWLRELIGVLTSFPYRKPEFLKPVKDARP